MSSTKTFGANCNWLKVDLDEKKVILVGAGDSYEGGTAARDDKSFFPLMLEALGTLWDEDIQELKKYAPYDSELRSALMILYERQLKKANKYRI